MQKSKSGTHQRQNNQIPVYKVFGNAFDYFFGDLNNRKIRFLIIYFIFISALEIFAYTMHGVFSVLASRIWLLGGIVTFLYIVIFFVGSLVSDFKEKKYFEAISVLLLIVFLSVFIGNVDLSEINPDAAQQAAAGLNSFSAGDWNYTGKAFLGYPNRQYIITAIPVLLFGRSIKALHMGFALPFILGLMILYSSLRKWAQKSGTDTIIPVLFLYALFVFPFVAEYYTNFEQAIYPISFTMIIIGFYLLILMSPNIISLICLAWIGCLLSNFYTPALATLGLVIVFIALLILLLLKRPDLLPFSVHSPEHTAKALIFTEINIIAFFTSTLLEKRQDRITELQSDIKIFKFSYNVIRDFLTDKNARFLGMFGIIVIIYIFAGLTLQLKKRDFLLSLWILGVFVASFLFIGYTSYQPEWIMQRALVVIPVVLTGITLNIFDWLKKYNISIKHGLATVIIISFACTGIYNFRQGNQSFTYFNFIQPMKYVFNDLEKTFKDNGISNEDEFNLILYTDNVLMKNPADYCKFFYPNANVYVPEYGQLPDDIDLSLTSYIYSDQEFCDEFPIDGYEMLAFKNTKHSTAGSWYKATLRNN